MGVSLFASLWPTNWEEFVSNFNNIWFIIDFCLGLLLSIGVSFLAFKLLKSRKTTFLYVIVLFMSQIALAFNLIILSITLAIVLLIATICILVVSGSEIRSILRDEFGWDAVFKNKKNKNELTNYAEICEIVESAVIDMSRAKCGALITFERQDRITTDRFSRWNDFDAQVTEAIIKTIFYKGSPLHDGATIIREGRIIRAGVIFDSVSVSTAAMPGSLGSRHRAALGITESCDCVSVTVSEETGSIHICEGGHIQKCYVSNFKEKLLELLKPVEQK